MANVEKRGRDQSESSRRRGGEVAATILKDVKPSQECGGDVSRTATEIGLTRQAAEDDALKAARDAAGRACKDKKCEGQGENCVFVEKSSTGSSGPVSGSNPPSYTATMTTTGSCACDK